MNDKEVWEKLAIDTDLIGGAVRHRDDEGRPVHSRISAVKLQGSIIAFQFDRVWFGPLPGGMDDPWMEFSPGMVGEHNSMWLPITGGFLRIEMQANGSAKVLPGMFPSYVEGIYPKRALPEGSPTTKW